MRLAGEVALITGATKNMGRAMAELFAAEGAAVTVTGRNEDPGREVVGAIEGAGGQAIFVRTDVSHESSLEHAVEETVKAFGKLTILVNNAAPSELLIGPKSVDSMSWELATDDWNALLTPILTGTFWGCKYAIPKMASAGGGAIINISSTGAVQGFAGHLAFAAAKSGLHGLTRSLAVEVAPLGIRVNCIIPGAVPQPGVTDRLYEDPEYGPALLAYQLTRVGRPTDIAAAALFLASREEAGFITGAFLAVDGGAMCRMPLPKLERFVEAQPS